MALIVCSHAAGARWCLGVGLMVMFGACGKDAPNEAPATATAGRPAKEPASVATATRVDPPAGPGAMAPALVHANGEVFGAWLEPINVADHVRDGGPVSAAAPPTYRLRVARLRGHAWGPAATIAEGPHIVANWADVPTIGLAGNGGVVASWASSSGTGVYSYDVRLARSTDHGRTWAPLGVAHTARTPAEYGFVSMVRDGNAVRAFWLDGRAAAGEGHGHGGAMTLRSAVVGSAITGEQLIDDRVCDCCGTAAARTDSGPVVVYRNRTDDELRDVWIARRVGNKWAAPQPVHRDGWKVAGCPVNGPAIAAQGMSVVVAWYTYANDRPSVRVAFSDDGGGNFGKPISIDGPVGQRAPLGRVGVVMTKPGHAVVSWMTTARETASIRVRRVGADGRLGADYELATSRAGRSAGFPRMVRAGSDLVMMWTEPGAISHLRAARVPLALVPAMVQASAGAVTVAEATSATARQPFRNTAFPRGEMVPALAARTLAGAPVTIASLRGAPVLLNIWATWCEPCRREIPALVTIAKRYKARGLRLVGLSVDRDRTRADIKRFIDRRKVTYDVWHDDQDSASTALGVGILPATYLIDRAGRIVWRHSGAVTAEDPRLHRAIGKLLARGK